jgi:uncharacterized protein (DUF736 family)
MPRWARPISNGKESQITTTIGDFTKAANGFTGTIQAIGLKAQVTYPGREAGKSQPDFRAFVGKVEIGAGWAGTGKGGPEFVSVNLDHPSFAARTEADLR